MPSIGTTKHMFVYLIDSVMEFLHIKSRISKMYQKDHLHLLSDLTIISDSTQNKNANQLRLAFLWRAWQDSNLRPTGS